MAAELEVGIGVDLKELTEGLKKVSSQLTEFSTKTKNDAEKAGNSWSDGFEKMVKGYLTFEAVTRVGGAAKNLLLLEERFNALKMPLANVTQATGDYGLALGFITRLADQTGQDLFVLGDSYKNLYASAKQAGFATDEINKIFGSVVRAGSALKLSNEQVSLSLKAVEQMMNKGTISSEELKGQLGEQLPGAYGMMAKAAQDAGISVSGSTQELGKLLEQGKVGSAQVLPFFAKRMEEAFGKNANANINTISGSANRMKNELTLLVSALDDSKVTSFWASIQNGIANTMKDLTFLIKSGSWQDFMEWTKGSVMVTGKRIGMEMQDQNFASKSKIEQIKEYNELNKDLLWHMNMVDKAARSGGHPVTDQVSKLADQVKRYKAIMGGGGANGKPNVPILGGEGEGKVIKNAGYKRLEAFKQMHKEEEALRDKQFFERLNKEKTYALELERLLSLEDLPKVDLDFGLNLGKSLNITGLKDNGISGLFNGMSESLMDNWTEFRSRFNELELPEFPSMIPLFEKLNIDISDGISAFEEGVIDKYLKVQAVVEPFLSNAMNGLANILATGLGNIFNQDVEFDPKKMIAQVLESVGAMIIGIAVPLVAALALGNAATLGGMSVQWGAALGMLGAGIAMKGGGMALASDSAGSTTGSSTTTNARSYSPYGGNGYGSMQTVEVRFANGALKGYIDNRDKKYNG